MLQQEVLDAEKLYCNSASSLELLQSNTGITKQSILPI